MFAFQKTMRKKKAVSGDHFVVCRNTEPLWCTWSYHSLEVDYTSVIKIRKEKKHQTSHTDRQKPDKYIHANSFG